MNCVSTTSALLLLSRRRPLPRLLSQKDTTIRILNRTCHSILSARADTTPTCSMSKPCPEANSSAQHEGGFESPTIFAVSEDNIYLMIIGDIEILLTDPEIELYFDVRYSMKDALYNARLDAPSVLPELDAAALPAKAGELAAKGDAAITRAGAAQLVFDPAHGREQERGLSAAIHRRRCKQRTRSRDSVPGQLRPSDALFKRRRRSRRRAFPA